jgi:hypothetical protein
MSASVIPTRTNCTLQEPGHDVFWLKAIKLLDPSRNKDRVKVQVEVVDGKYLLLELNGTNRIMFNHHIERLASALSQPNAGECSFVEWTGYLYVAHGRTGSWVFSLSNEETGSCVN